MIAFRINRSRQSHTHDKSRAPAANPYTKNPVVLPKRKSFNFCKLGAEKNVVVTTGNEFQVWSIGSNGSRSINRTSEIAFGGYISLSAPQTIKVEATTATRNTAV